MIEIASFLIMSIFLGLGIYSLRTGIAVIQSHRIHREKNYYLFWGVVSMWFMAAFLTAVALFDQLYLRMNAP